MDELNRVMQKAKRKAELYGFGDESEDFAQ
jgi:hypothetical protein